MIRKRISAPLGIAAAVIGLVCICVMPVATADQLSNGFTVDCTPDSDVHVTCIIGGCARVHGDYVIDAVHVMHNGIQDEYGFKCINAGTTARWGHDGNQDFTIGVQGCRKKDLEGDWCGPWADYSYKKPAPAAPPSVNCSDGSTVPAGQSCPTPKPATVQCSDGTSVPAGQSCPIKPVTDAISLSFSPPGLGSITATISNSSDLNGKCTYDATPFDTHRDFNVPAHGSTPLTFNGFNTGTSYHAVVSCLDASGKQTQPIGTATQDVRF